MVQPNENAAGRSANGGRDERESAAERDPRGKVSAQHAQGATPASQDESARHTATRLQAQSQGQSPFALMSRLSDEMDRLFDGFWLSPFSRSHARGIRGNGGARSESTALWTPDVDVYENNGEIVVRADLPGLKREDVKVELTPDALTIQGERKSECEESGGGWHHSECRYGTFFRSIPLPDGVDASQIKAEFDNGVLHVRMPAPRRNERRSIAVEGRSEQKP